MKLLNKENLLQIPVYLFIFILVGIGFYYAAEVILHEKVEETLRERKEYLLRNVDDIGEFMKYQKYSFNSLKIEHTNLLPTKTDYIGDTLLYDVLERNYELCSQLVFIINEKGQNYKITLIRARVNTSKWAISIAQVVLLVFLILLVLLFVANVLISKRIWRPFYELLDKLSYFKISEPGNINFPPTNIDEFTELSQVLNRMMEKIKADYVNLKKFSENASHEFQTPISVIQLKLDHLLQSNNLSMEEVESVSSVLKSVKKLSKLNESLLLLTKIENRQFVKIEAVSLNNIIKEKIENLKELIDLRQIRLNTSLDEVFEVKMDPLLADLLIENLLSNAIKHNFDGGEIIITTSGNEIQIKNTGNPLTVNTSQLFERFGKSNQNSKSLGLGLAIVKEICNTYPINIDYQSIDQYHILTLYHKNSTATRKVA